MDFDFSEVLRRMVEAKASDVHLTPGFPPAIRDKGKIVPMDGFPVLDGQETREVVYSILNDDQRKRFETNKQLDFAYAIPNVARFRVNCFFQRGSVSAALIVGISKPPRPSSVHSACNRPSDPSGSGEAASFRSDGITESSLLSTSSRCAVSRHQPLECERCLTQSSGVSLLI